MIVGCDLGDGGNMVSSIVLAIAKRLLVTVQYQEPRRVLGTNNK